MGVKALCSTFFLSLVGGAQSIGPVLISWEVCSWLTCHHLPPCCLEDFQLLNIMEAFSAGIWVMVWFGLIFSVLGGFFWLMFLKTKKYFCYFLNSSNIFCHIKMFVIIWYQFLSRRLQRGPKPHEITLSTFFYEQIQIFFFLEDSSHSSNSKFFEGLRTL